MLIIFLISNNINVVNNFKLYSESDVKNDILQYSYLNETTISDIP